jgi:hypothetical protein
MIQDHSSLIANTTLLIIVSTALMLIGLVFLILAIDDARQSRNMGRSIRRMIIGMTLALTSIPITLTSLTPANSRAKDIPLSSVADQISIDDDKVKIDKLPEKIKYKPSKLYHDDADQSDQIFKFETDEFYNKSYLIDSDHVKYDLSEEDANYLKSKQAKGEK